MEIDRLIHIIKNPDTSDCKEIEIDSLKKKYPYCQTFTMISMMQRHQQGVFGFEEELENSAHKILDRGVLYEYLTKETIPSELSLESVIESKEIIIEEEVINPAEDDNKTQESSVERIKPPTVDQTIDEKEVAYTELDFDIINSAIDSSIQLEVEAESEQTAFAHNAKLETEEETADNTNKIEADNRTSAEAAIEIDTERPKSFIGWLKAQEFPKAPEVELTSLTEQTEHNEKNDIAKEAAKKELLDKFIEAEPRISKPKKEFFSPTKKAKESLTENDDLITETLAKIYVLQKNYSKAIDAYQKLSLIYPEKKAFFANQIQRIKDKQNI